MELFFNELSIKDENKIHRDCMMTIAEVYKELVQFDVTTCRIDSADSMKLFQMISQMPNSANVKNFYFSFFRAPYESESVEKNQDEYFSHSWVCGGEECTGLALAWILDTACISLNSLEWNISQAELFRDKEIYSVRNICTKDHVRIHIPRIQAEGEVELAESGLKVSDKKIAIRHDHGMDELEEFAKRLVSSPYLIEVVNSLPYQPHERKFIKKIRQNGLIEIVLPWTDEGLGLVVKTTGRNMRETEKIADIIKEKFGYR